MATVAAACSLSAAAFANCGEVTFSDVGWTDITATTAAPTQVLKALGQETDVKVLSVPVTYAAMAQGDEGSVDTVGLNLAGAKYTAAVNKIAADLGVKDFADLPRFHSESRSSDFDIARLVADQPLTWQFPWLKSQVKTGIQSA